MLAAAHHKILDEPWRRRSSATNPRTTSRTAAGGSSTFAPSDALMIRSRGGYYGQGADAVASP